MIAAGSTGSMPATAELIATIARLPHGAVVLPGLDTDLDAESWDLIAGRRDAAGRELIPPAVGHPQFAMQALLRADRNRTRRDLAPRPTRSARARAHGVGGAAAGRRHRPLAAARRLRFSGTCRRRVCNPVGGRGRQCRGRGARHRGRAARGDRDGRQDRGADHARPRAGAPRARRAGTLARRGRRFRRRCAPRHVGRAFRAPCGRGGARRPRPGYAARVAQAPADAAWRRRRVQIRARWPPWNERSCAAPAPSQRAAALPMRLQRFGKNSASFGAAKNPICIRPIPAST